MNTMPKLLHFPVQSSEHERQNPRDAIIRHLDRLCELCQQDPGAEQEARTLFDGVRRIAVVLRKWASGEPMTGGAQ